MRAWQGCDMPSSDEEKPDTRAGATAGKAHAAQLAQLELLMSELELRLARWQQRLVTVSIVTVSTLLLISAYLSFGSPGGMYVLAPSVGAGQCQPPRLLTCLLQARRAQRTVGGSQRLPIWRPRRRSSMGSSSRTTQT